MADEHQLAAGWDNAAGFTPLADMTVSGARPIYGDTLAVARGWDQYERGERRFDLSGGASFAGFKQVVWRLDGIDTRVWQHLIDTYEGQVTVRTEVGVEGVYENWNAYLSVPDPAESESTRNRMTIELRFRLVNAL